MRHESERKWLLVGGPGGFQVPIMNEGAGFTAYVGGIWEMVGGSGLLVMESWPVLVLPSGGGGATRPVAMLDTV